MTADPVEPADLTRSSAYDYELPADRIARYPTERRDESRLLVVDRKPAEGPEGVAFHHLRFRDLAGLVRAGDLLVLNESRVIPVRLLGRKPTGAKCEVLLLRPCADADAADADADADSGESWPRRWEAIVRPGSKLKPGRRVVIAEGFEVQIEEGTPDGGRIVRLECDIPVEDAIERWGHIPLPPYLDRHDEPLDRERYQTVYARVPGSVAAPTAGLHFTPELLDELESRGVELARVALHVGPGTFRPVDVDRIDEHSMHVERWVVPPETSGAIARTRAEGGRVWAVGTTVVRTLESAVRVSAEDGATEPGGPDSEKARPVVLPGRGDTRLFITPGFDFRVVDGLITNFHLPRSTLLMLVSAFAGHGRTMAAYREAIREGYRFYSYGDAMVIPPEEPVE